MSWKEEHAETTVMEHLNNSVSAYRDSLHQPETLLNPELRDILKKEQRLSLRLETTLEASCCDRFTSIVVIFFTLIIIFV